MIRVWIIIRIITTIRTIIESIHDHAAPPARLSRRHFLAASAGTLAGVLLLKAEQLIGKPLLPAPAAQKRIYIAPDDHTDYFWTADDVTYRSAFLEMLDYYLDNADNTASNASPYQSRWNCDGTLWVWEYERNRSAAQFQRLIDRIADGHISVPLNPLCVVLGGAPAEAVLRGMYYAGSLQRRYSLEFPLAYSMENQTLPYGIGALWAGAGAKYQLEGHLRLCVKSARCRGIASMTSTGGWDRMAARY